MANLTLDQPRAKYPPEDRVEDDRAYAAAALAGLLAAAGRRQQPRPVANPLLRPARTRR